MPQITAWECPQSKKLFSDIADYKVHLKTTARANRIAKKWSAKTSRLTSVIAGARLVNDMQEWCDYVMVNQESFILAGALGSGFDRDAFKQAMMEGCDIVLPVIESIAVDGKYSASVSNSHCHPEGGVENFMRVDSRPVGYPGWHGTASMRYADNKNLIVVTRKGRKKKYQAPSMADILRRFDGSHCGAHAGSGGGGPHGYRYGVSIFLSDMTKMAENATIARLKGNARSEIDNLGRGRYDIPW